ncbi:DNA-binding response regulator [Ferrigenium kumadai]|uniref:DNA-binding response regulator n=1 Tax=Ferrigenium kumadai TaxID=1682490 RepID=A0AAN1SZU6_9PROT|nr:response regulator transcription factor [Ferrigenium kumadai]BBJ00136.1 DNA-binding response regulator [Ferrigenium kumadai]
MIRVLIVDDHAIVRQGLRRIMDETKDIRVGGEATNGVEALKKIRSEKWDIVLLDISMPEKNGIDTLKLILDGNSAAKVLMLSMYPEDQHAVRLLKGGASGYLTKDAAPEQLVEAIRKVMAGKKHISPVLAELLLHECGRDSAKPPHEMLSDREYQVLRLLGSGKKVSEVARILALSVKTVSTYRVHILEKMKLKNNAELMLYVVENGLREL